MFFFNYDSFELGAIAFVVSGILIYYYSGYSVVPHAKVNNNSLVNTNTVESSSVIGSNQYVEASVQTANVQVDATVQAANHYVNAGMQTSARMWLESIRNWITEILGTTPNPQGGLYVDVGVQTNAPSTWQTVKQWFLDVCSLRSSQLSSLGQNKVEKWRDKLDTNQSVNLHDSESPLTTLRFGNGSELENLVDPNDSASQISSVVSEASLQVPSNSVYDINIYNQEFLYQSLTNQSNYIDYNHIIDGVNHTVLVIGNNLLTVDPNIVINPFIC